MIFSFGFPKVFCAKTAPNTPLVVAASTQRNFSAFSSIKFPNSGACVSNTLICSKACLCSDVGRKTFLLLVKGVKMEICLMTSKVTTLRSELTNPKNALTAFLLSGNLNSLTFCIRRGSAMT